MYMFECCYVNRQNAGMAVTTISKDERSWNFLLVDIQLGAHCGEINSPIRSEEAPREYLNKKPWPHVAANQNL